MSLPRALIGAVLAAVVIVIAAAAGWWFFVREDNELATSAPEIPSDLQTPSVESTAGSGSGEGMTFVIIGERSEAAYFADEQLASLPLPSTAKGSTNDIEGSFHLAADGWQLDGSQESVVTVDLTSLTSDEDRRDNRVREALNVATYPTATFTITSVGPVDMSLDPSVEQTFEITGIMDLRGVQKELTWEVKARREGNVMTALATTTFRYDDFAIPPPNIAGFVTVGEEVTLQLQVVATAG